MAEKKLSGAPDTETKAASPIWNERNELVEPEMDAHFKREADRVLGRGEFEPKPPVAEGAGGEIDLGIPPTAPAVSQRLDSQTEDPLSNPKPTGDINAMPSPFATYPDEVAERDREVIEEAKAEFAAQLETDKTVEIENTGGNPVRSDEKGNVRGNPAGAEGGANPTGSTESGERTIPPRDPTE